MSVSATGILLGCIAAVVHRADLLVVAAPLLLWALMARSARPRTGATARIGLASPSIGEGGATALHVDIEHGAGAETVGFDLAPGPRLLTDPPSGALHRDLGGDRGTTRLSVGLAPSVWGRHPVGGGELRLTSAWGGYLHQARPGAGLVLDALPAPRRTRLPDDRLSPAHLIGRHLSRRPGDGSEFAEIREWHPGDRIRRIHWPTSARTGTLHVRTTYAEQDAQVVLLVDAVGDIAAADERVPSSVEAAVQAAAHVSSHFLEAGDRVGLRVLGDGSLPVPAGPGRRQLQRILLTLSRVEVAAERLPDVERLHLGLQPGSLLVALTPLTSSVVVDAVAGLARRGVDTAVLDVAPLRPLHADAADALAWRILDLERSRTRDRLAASGVPVVGWEDESGVGELLRHLQARREAARR